MYRLQSLISNLYFMIDTNTIALPIPAERDTTPSDALIARCLAGEDRAFALLYDLHAADIYRLCYNLLQHREDAEEVLQDAFEYAFRRLSTYDASKSAFRTWLYRIAISRCRNKRRRKWLPTFSLNALSGDTIPDTQTPTPSEIAQMTEQQKMVWTALGKLSPKLRETAVLRYYNAMSYPEIGAVLGVNPKTIESRMRLAHKALKEYLQDEID
jgi:RNA polymerase sigma-70 factor (ECF subfamily)